MRDETKKYKVFTRRAFVVGGAKTILLSALAARLYYLQVLDSNQYKTLSDNNRIRIILTPPERGAIFDKNGVELALDSISYSVVLNKNYLPQAKELIKKINKLLGYESYLSRQNLKKVIQNTPKGSGITIQENLNFSEIAKIEVNTNLKGVEIIEKYKRKYILAENAAHVLGYISKPDESEVKNSKIPNYYEFMIGKNGVERVFDENLQGFPGVKKVEVNVLGDIVRDLDFTPGKSGNPVTVSLDHRVQKILADNIAGYTGSLGVMNLKNGKIEGMYSSPSYNPNEFVYGISDEEWNNLIKNPKKPLVNKFIYNAYPPGSTFKLASVLAILNAGIDPNQTVHCSGQCKIGNRVFHCWKKYGHGEVNFLKAVSQSCNIYFYQKTIEAGIDILSNTAKMLGFGEKTGIELPFENQGVMPNRKWKKQKYKESWQLGDTVNTSIGQGYVQTTPIQLLQMVARIATGTDIRPSLLLNQNQTTSPLPIKKEYLDLLRQGMLRVFNAPSGTGFRNRIDVEDFYVAGKSGTAQVVGLDRQTDDEQYKDHGLFVGFAPFKDPKYAIAVVIEHGGWGSKSAVPIAKKVFEDMIRNGIFD